MATTPFDEPAHPAELAPKQPEHTLPRATETAHPRIRLGGILLGQLVLGQARPPRGAAAVTD
ncbi:hypothetical protein [Nocardia bovistercoris]|uniref:Uncharacterized protein n=1 Tax=Nocardia bovistercoris TaxID=2785916 RepID=A0A931IA15_9NOCA|nr:hypothetical protein [Nocardia bovistercoris]MBH0777504.1 hypothetical protein [Nocardia bovistercoris]